MVQHCSCCGDALKVSSYVSSDVDLYQARGWYLCWTTAAKKGWRRGMKEKTAWKLLQTVRVM